MKGLIFCYKDPENIYCLKYIENIEIEDFKITARHLNLNSDERDNCKDIHLLYPSTEFIIRSDDIEKEMLNISPIIYRLNRIFDEENENITILNYLSKVPKSKIIFSYL